MKCCKRSAICCAAGCPRIPMRRGSANSRRWAGDIARRTASAPSIRSTVPATRAARSLRPSAAASWGPQPRPRSCRRVYRAMATSTSAARCGARSPAAMWGAIPTSRTWRAGPDWRRRTAATSPTWQPDRTPMCGSCTSAGWNQRKRSPSGRRKSPKPTGYATGSKVISTGSRPRRSTPVNWMQTASG